MGRAKSDPWRGKGRGWTRKGHAGIIIQSNAAEQFTNAIPLFGDFIRLGSPMCAVPPGNAVGRCCCDALTFPQTRTYPLLCAHTGTYRAPNLKIRALFAPKRRTPPEHATRNSEHQHKLSNNNRPCQSLRATAGAPASPLLPPVTFAHFALPSKNIYPRIYLRENYRNSRLTLPILSPRQ